MYSRCRWCWFNRVEIFLFNCRYIYTLNFAPNVYIMPYSNTSKQQDTEMLLAWQCKLGSIPPILQGLCELDRFSLSYFCRFSSCKSCEILQRVCRSVVFIRQVCSCYCKTIPFRASTQYSKAKIQILIY